MTTDLQSAQGRVLRGVSGIVAVVAVAAAAAPARAQPAAQRKLGIDLGLQVGFAWLDSMPPSDRFQTP